MDCSQDREAWREGGLFKIVASNTIPETCCIQSRPGKTLYGPGKASRASH